MQGYRRFRLPDWLRLLWRYPLFGRGPGGFRSRPLARLFRNIRSPFRRHRWRRRYRRTIAPGSGRAAVRRPSVGGALLRLLVLTALLFAVFMWIADRLLLEPLTAVAETEARRRGVDGINKVILGTIGENLRPEDLMQFKYDKDGRIVAYSVDTRLVNRTGTEAAAAVKDEFRNLSSSPIKVPMGALTGIRLLSGTGPGLKVTMIPVGTVTADLMQAFESAGVNQTRHRTWVQVTAKVRMMLPLTTREITVSSEVPITDTVIVGQVPTYFGGSIGRVSLPVEPGVGAAGTGAGAGSGTGSP